MLYALAATVPACVNAQTCTVFPSVTSFPHLCRQLDEAPTLGSGLGSRIWLRETAQKLLACSFVLCRSHKDVEALLAHCARLHKAPELLSLAPLLASLQPSLYKGFDWALLWAPAAAERACTLASLVARLNEAGQFERALQLARAAHLPLADVALTQVAGVSACGGPEKLHSI